MTVTHDIMSNANKRNDKGLQKIHKYLIEADDTTPVRHYWWLLDNNYPYLLLGAEEGLSDLNGCLKDLFFNIFRINIYKQQ